MRCLVTGGGGFLGRYIAEQLVRRGDRVRVFARGNYPELAEMGMECVRGNIRDASAVARVCQNIDIVFHTAAVAGIWGSWQYYYDINTAGTDHVIQACQQHGVRKLVFTSSPSVTFDGSDQVGVDESAPYPRRWLSHYPHTKALAEQAVLRAHNQQGLATCALRPHLIWGPRDTHLIPRLLERARHGQLRRVGDGTNLVDMIYVENAAQAHLQAADVLSVNSAVGGRAYFLSQGEPVNCWTWINEILQLAGLPPINKSISRSAAWRIGSVLEIVYRLLRIQSEPRMTRFLASQLSTHHYFDIRRAREDFGYAPTISTPDGMGRLAKDIRPPSN